MERVHKIFPDGNYKDIWDKLFYMYDYFTENEKYVGQVLGFSVDNKESEEVRKFLKERKNQSHNYANTNPNM
jgi:hypothetical protein